MGGGQGMRERGWGGPSQGVDFNWRQNASWGSLKLFEPRYEIFKYMHYGKC